MRDYDELKPLPTDSSTHFPPNPSLRPPSEQQGPSAWGALPAPDFPKQLSCLPQVSARLPSPRRRGPPLLRVMSAPPRPPQEHCGQIWRTQQCLGAGTDWGGGAAAPGRDCWQLARGRGAPRGGGGGHKDKSRREAGPPSLPLAHRLQARPTFQAHSWGPMAPTQGPAGDPPAHTAMPRSTVCRLHCCVGAQIDAQ